MKLQDIIFILILSFLFYKKNSSFFVIAGLLFLLFAIPLFASWVFFTAERFTWYAAACFLIAIIIILLKERSGKT